MQDTTARVLSCEPLAQELVRLILSAPEIAAQAKAGQFIHMAWCRTAGTCCAAPSA